MSSRKCPICNKTVSNLLQHLAMSHNIRNPAELRTLTEPLTLEPEPDSPLVPTSINWDTEFYKILSRLSSEKRVIFIEKELDDLLTLVDRVENKDLIAYGRNVLSNLHFLNEDIVEKVKSLLYKFE